MNASYAVNVALHYGLDMTGAVTIACLMRGCNNPEHKHRPIVAMLTKRPWITQSALALAVAMFTVRMIG